ncbi:hypothetical protein MYSTI_02155 [Myxococcus stipitatus DSM 14675]|uniref:Lipoprotein n=1 Tax=Myxococcus stipitatus (strain DSM 14675 / JCM 12634 / Mx s8) TaxID=1278073 RepID=L7U7E9_MYXSD|nr:hypothetical protein [Myxococcus stipitatus]AGC43482.1 hypothetical protein MYSTI_02155 [Myxococcus stipitatus DSM 14675]
MRTRLLPGLCLSALTVFCSCRSVPRPGEAGAAGEPLPEFFGPVTWTSTEAELRTAFPEAQVDNRDFDSQVPGALGILALEGARLPPFGDARVRLLRRGGVPTGVLVIESIDNAAQTCPEAPEEFADCAKRLEQKRQAVFESLAGPLRRRYGPASVDAHFGSDEAEGQDPRQFSLTWKVPGYTLELGTGQEPSGHAEWTVRLVAIRDLEYPFL